MDKKEVAAILEDISTLLEIKGENLFKIRAYENAARTLLGMSEELGDLVESGKIRQIKGIGSALSQKITELVTTGKLEYYENLKETVPEGLVEMSAIPGFGPKKIKKVFDELEIKSIAELEKAAGEDRLVKLDGFDRKTQDKILRGIEFLRRHKGRHHYHKAKEAAGPVFDAVASHPKVIRAELTGSLRRVSETVKDIDIVAGALESDIEEILNFFTTLPEVESVTGRGQTKSSVVLKKGMNADLRVMTDDKFPYLLHHFTGSAEHNTEMRGRARKKGLKISEYGLFREDGALVWCKDETDFFSALGLAYIPPELREANGEIEAAAENNLPRLVEPSDIRGILHCHSTWSDGLDTLEEMAVATKKLGYAYFGICDHSQIVVYAHGMTHEQVTEQHAAIDELNEGLGGFKILKGTECDILNDGTLDYPDEVLASFDFVVVSIHTNFNMSLEVATERILTALKNPHVNILGHPTGRILLGREGYPLDMNRIIDAAAECEVAIELNASPYRFDLDWRNCKIAKEKGVMISINPDAHSVRGLRDMAYGIGVARKGWLQKENVLNAMTRDEIETYFLAKKNRI